MLLTDIKLMTTYCYYPRYFFFPLLLVAVYIPLPEQPMQRERVTAARTSSRVASCLRVQTKSQRSDRRTCIGIIVIGGSRV